MTPPVSRAPRVPSAKCRLGCRSALWAAGQGEEEEGGAMPLNEKLDGLRVEFLVNFERPNYKIATRIERKTCPENLKFLS